MDLGTFRKQKDLFFKSDPHSPLLPPQKDGFDGLSYFDPNPDLRFELEIEPFEEQASIRMQTSTGSLAEYVRWGRIHFEVEGEGAELTIYAAVGAGGYFLPFMDSTSAKESYGAGRYLDLEPTRDGRVVVDFNYAYNPYCAYNPPRSLFVKMGREYSMIWSCPIPPAENRLSVPIRAGEKIPTGPWVDEEENPSQLPAVAEGE
jgi:hypothetical protein